MDPVPAPTRRISPRNLIILLVVVLLAGSAIFMAGLSFNPNSSEKRTAPEEEKPAMQELNLHSVIYGVWGSAGADIRAYDLQMKKEYSLGMLPINVKRISILSPEKLLFINNVNQGDHGDELAVYDVKTKSITTLVKANDGFGIDEYVISKNKEYISTWEVKVHEFEGVKKLSGGESRVYTTRVSSPGQKNLIYNEPASETSPVHYPIGILDDGTVFMDRFTPNASSGVGFAHGMSKSDFSGSQKGPIESMENGTYGTQPVMSHDGRFIAFAGYDGSRGDGASIAREMRRATLSSNSIELLNTSTLERTPLANLEKSNIYNNITWGENDNALLFDVLSRNTSVMGKHTYDINSQTLTKITLPVTFTPLAYLANGSVIGGTMTQLQNTIGNLGSYGVPLSAFYLNDPGAGTSIKLPPAGPLMQYITYYDGKYSPADTVDNSKSKTNLQLETFYLKPSLQPVRTTQQTGDRCRDYAAQQCNELLGTNYTGDEAIQMIQGHRGSALGRGAPSSSSNQSSSDSAFAQCASEQFSSGQQQRLCSDSPLYLYGPEGLQVSIKVWTHVSQSVPADKNGEYQVTLGRNGTFTSGNTSYPSIKYSYEPAIKRIDVPKTGRVVTPDAVEKTLREYAKKLALNEQETQDLVEKGQEVATGPYTFISFFDHETSHAILPITFSPKPDNYRNIVFYFRNIGAKPNFSIEEPTFTPVKRGGFTAVEISEIVE